MKRKIFILGLIIMFGNVQVFTVHADTQDSIVNSGGSSTEDSVSGIEEVQKQQQ
ncbi:MAG: hypothetical protein HUJ74_04115, partial [Lachnospiraceae bacterium]|nr:hypothetical protein [Lachnospiraceae bacterium]